MYEGDQLVSSYHAREMAWCAPSQLGWFGECRFRFFYGVLPMAAIDPTVVLISTDKLDPAHDAEDDYRRWTNYVYSTREHRTLWVRMHDDGSFEIHKHGAVLERFVRKNAA